MSDHLIVLVPPAVEAPPGALWAATAAARLYRAVRALFWKEATWSS